MKATIILLGFLSATAPGLRAATKAAAPARAQAEVTFVAPEKFTDVRDSYTGTDAGRDGILNQLREYMLDETNRYIPAGDRLLVSVTDIDLAGDFEPWRGPNWSDVRIVKDIYPPRIDLSFRLTDANGQVVREGTRKLTDLAFLWRITTTFADDPLCHEKTLLNDWFQDEFRGLKGR